MKKIIRYLFILIVIFSGLIYGQWIKTDGPYGGGYVRCLANSDGKIFAGAQNGVFLSTDSGSSWIKIIDDLLNTPKAIAAADSYLFVGSNGVQTYIYNDSGAILQDHWLNSTVNVLTVDGNRIYAGTFSGLYHSDNNGLNWSNTTLQDTIIESVTAGDSNIYVGTEKGAVYISNNNGSTWSKTTNGLLPYTEVYSIAEVDTVLYIGTNQGVFFSTDFGENWTAANIGLTETYLYSLVAIDSFLFVGTNGDGIFRSTNNSVPWNIFWEPVNNGVTFLFINNFTYIGSELYASSYNDGIYKTNDYGENWNTFNYGLCFDDILCMTAHDSMVFASRNNIYSYSENNDLWKECKIDSMKDWVILSVYYDSIGLFAGISYDDHNEHGLYRSYDFGESWQLIRREGLYVRYINIIDSNIFYTTQSGLFKTNIDGSNHITGKGLPDAFINCVIYDESNYYAGTDSGIYLSNDKGINWSSASNGSNAWMRSTKVKSFAKIDTEIFAGLYGYGIFSSNDGGETWSPKNVRLTNNYITSLFAEGNSLLIGTTGGGVFISHNLGDDWSTFNEGLTRTNIKAIAKSFSNIYLATDSSGVWKRNLSDVILKEDGFSHLLFNSQNIKTCPNPFNPVIKISLPIQHNEVKMEIYTITGKRIFKKNFNKFNFYIWDAKNYGSGLFVVKLIFNNKVISKRICLLK